MVACLAIVALVAHWASAEAEAAGGDDRPPFKRQMERLDRGLVAIKVDEGVFLSWRWLGVEPSEIGFHVYRDGERLTVEPIVTSTNFLDREGRSGSSYCVAAVLDGVEGPPCQAVGVLEDPYLTVPLQRPPDGQNPDGSPFTYHANDASVGDLDGDGAYEIVLKWEPSNAKDNAHDGVTGPVFLDAYRLDGTWMWRISLGRNIRAGAHYTQFIVYDLDGDGKAEVALKTADGTVSGAGEVIGDPDADYRNAQGRVLEGPEYLTIFDGETGAVRVAIDFQPERGQVSDWGDAYGNRVDRFLGGVAYLDGERPSLIMARGYYAKTAIAAYDFRENRLSLRWLFDTARSGEREYEGQGNHSLSIADVDGDGMDEIIYGAMAIDHDGTGLYSTGLGHGDAMHLGDLAPRRPGLEVFQVHEDRNARYHASLRDAATGEILWGVRTGQDTGRGLAADIDPRYPGAEVWASAGVGLYTSDGAKIASAAPGSINFAIWWDGDLLRELLDHHWFGSRGIGKIDKWDYETGRLANLLTATGTESNNGTKGTPSLQADILGDWREEVIWRTADSSSLRIYTTTALTEHKIYTLMHDPVYRLGVAWQNVAYNQPPHTSFFLGHGMKEPPLPSIRIAGTP